MLSAVAGKAFYRCAELLYVDFDSERMMRRDCDAADSWMDAQSAFPLMIASVGVA